MRQNWIEVSGWQRGNFRRELTKAGIEFAETKGWWTSVFVIADANDYYSIMSQLKRQGFL